MHQQLLRHNAASWSDITTEDVPYWLLSELFIWADSVCNVFLLAPMSFLVFGLADHEDMLLPDIVDICSWT